MFGSNEAVKRTPLSNWHWVIAIVVWAVHPSALFGQHDLRVDGRVIDAVTAQPIIGAIVTLATAGGARAVRSDGGGHFRFVELDTGHYTVSVRGIGYTPRTLSLNLIIGQTISVPLRRLALLDTIHVRSTVRGIFGTVATANDLRPIANALVQAFGSSLGEVRTDSSGHFFLEIKSPGPYLVRGSAQGMGSHSVSLRVDEFHNVEVAILIDSNPSSKANRIGKAFADLRERLARRGMSSVIASREELMSRGDGELMSSLLLLATGRGLRLGSRACLFIDGESQPGAWLNELSADDVDMLEVYSASADQSLTLARSWPRGAPCGNTGMPAVSVAPTSGAGRLDTGTLVHWVTVWLRH